MFFIPNAVVDCSIFGSFILNFIYFLFNKLAYIAVHTLKGQINGGSQQSGGFEKLTKFNKRGVKINGGVGILETA